MPAGRLLVLDDSTVYGFGRFNQYHRNGTHVGLGDAKYMLFASKRTPPPVPIDPCIANDRGRSPVPRRKPLNPRIGDAKINKQAKAKRRGGKSRAASKVPPLWTQAVPLLARISHQHRHERS